MVNGFRDNAFAFNFDNERRGESGAEFFSLVLVDGMKDVLEVRVFDIKALISCEVEEFEKFACFLDIRFRAFYFNPVVSGNDFHIEEGFGARYVIVIITVE